MIYEALRKTLLVYHNPNNPTYICVDVTFFFFFICLFVCYLVSLFVVRFLQIPSERTMVVCITKCRHFFVCFFFYTIASHDCASFSVRLLIALSMLRWMWHRLLVRHECNKNGLYRVFQPTWGPRFPTHMRPTISTYTGWINEINKAELCYVTIFCFN